MQIMWKKVFVATLGIVSRHFPEVTEKTMLNFSQNNHCHVSV